MKTASTTRIMVGDGLSKWNESKYESGNPSAKHRLRLLWEFKSDEKYPCAAATKVTLPVFRPYRVWDSRPYAWSLTDENRSILPSRTWILVQKKMLMKIREAGAERWPIFLNSFATQLCSLISSGFCLPHQFLLQRVIIWGIGGVNPSHSPIERIRCLIYRFP